MGKPQRLVLITLFFGIDIVTIRLRRFGIRRNIYPNRRFLYI